MVKNRVLSRRFFFCAAVLVLICTNTAVGLVKAQPTIEILWPDWDQGASQNLVRTAVERVAQELNTPIDVQFISNYALCGCRCSTLNPDVNARVAGGQADIFLLESTVADTYYQSGYSTAAPDDVIRNVKENLQPFPSALEAFQVSSGSTEAIPYLSIQYTVFYNVDILEKLGIAIPSLTPSWDDFVSLNNALAASNDYRTGFLTEPSLGAFYVFSANGGVTANPQVWMDTATKYADQTDQITHASNTYTTDYSSLLNDFASGQTAVAVAASSYLNALRANGFQGNVSFSTLPTYPGSKFEGGNHVLGLTVTNKGNQDVAWQVVNQLIMQPEMIEWGARNGFLPAFDAGY